MGQLWDGARISLISPIKICKAFIRSCCQKAPVLYYQSTCEGVSIFTDTGPAGQRIPQSVSPCLRTGYLCAKNAQLSRTVELAGLPCSVQARLDMGSAGPIFDTQPEVVIRCYAEELWCDNLRSQQAIVLVIKYWTSHL